MYLHRTLEGFFEKAAREFPVMLLTGARQVGKTTLLRRLAQSSRTCVTLDDPMALRLAKAEPSLFLQRFSPPVLIDEIQYAPELLPWIKMEVDRVSTPGMFWLTGSQKFHLMQGVSESLAGRVGIVELLGLSRSEAIGLGSRSTPFLPTPERLAAGEQIGKRLSLQELYRMIWRGSLPAIAAAEGKDRDLFYGSYVQTYLQRDVRDLARVGDEMAFLRFLRAAAARSGGLLNTTELARDADVAPNTAKSWLSILQASGVVYLLEPYHSNVTKRLVKAPKLYFLDTGLCAYLTGWSSPETLEAGAMSGAILETWVVGEILKTWFHNGLTPPVFYYRDRDQYEIDLLIVRDGMAYPIEVKKTASPTADTVRNFQLLEKLGMPIGPGCVVCLTQQWMPLTAKTSAIPASVI